MTFTHSAFPDSDDIDGDALDWLVRRQDAGFGADDETAFQTWLAADARHRGAYARQRAEWATLDRLPASGLEILRANLKADLAAERSSRRRFLLPALSATAVAAVAGVAGVMTWGPWQTQPSFALNFSTQRGQQFDMRLPDDSHLWLDTATRVEVRYFRQRREVTLAEGQAVFRVQTDKARPFDVFAGASRVTVVGTRFSVRHTPAVAGDAGVRVAVEEGRVRIRPIGAEAADGLYLGAGEQTASDALGVFAPVSPVSTAGIAPWRSHRVSFDDARLDQVLAELDRYGDTRLVIRDAAVAGLRITGTFDPSRPDSFTHVLPQAAPVRLRKVGGLTEIVRAPMK